MLVNTIPEDGAVRLSGKKQCDFSITAFEICIVMGSLMLQGTGVML
jgi:hypothetical protein